MFISSECDHKDALPSVGIMLATYNGEPYVGAQIDSILAQQGVRPTIYVRDDGSSDRTLTILHRYAKNFPRQVILLPSTSPPFGAACGTFLSMVSDLYTAPHDYFAFSDQDDIWMPGKIERAVKKMACSGAAGYSSNLTAFSAKNSCKKLIFKAHKQRTFDHLFQSASAGCTYVLSASAMELIAFCIRRRRLDEFSGMSHDWLTYAICRSHGLSWCIDDYSAICYRQHEHNQYGAMLGITGTIRRLRLIRKGWYRDVVLRNRPFLDATNIAEQTIFNRITRLSFADRFWLIANAGKLRRAPRDCIALAIAVALGLI